MAFVERTREGEQEIIYDEPKRLSDFLREDDEEFLLEINSKCDIHVTPAKSGLGLNQLSRFLWFRRRKEIKEEEKKQEKERKKEKVKKDDSVRNCSEEISNSSVIKSGNSSLPLGMGIGLFLLLSKSTSEYNKMADLHKQMKTLLEEIKKEFENKSRVCSLCSTSSDLSSDLYKICGEEDKGKNGVPRCVNMDQMEAELAIELGQMRFSEDSSSLIKEEQRDQIPGEWIDFCENLGSNFEQFDETWEDDCSQNCGVSPYELERKLHELLHQRQQERIEELEYQLHSLERKLFERETEINRWKNIAATSSKFE
ncbi:Protein POLAR LOCALIZATION DURING ASYMMETRIC DIVISION AND REDISTRIBUTION [Rhynchospora pubera]|uniref:Protein POLAR LOCALIZATION DURING ASYMMETRIC DIVISION AND REDISTRIBUTION n=1 Tax=Rhynchospora pubera TaxID=906938 RepID=A0AAV8BXW3_9POAL|nr:Protein POLAR LOCALIZATION DURING ASYMMETRIC DIVISION AND REDISTRIBUTION [Rhynchospora pubera]